MLNLSSVLKEPEEILREVLSSKEAHLDYLWPLPQNQMVAMASEPISIICSGGQGKIQIQTLFDHASQRVLQLHLRRTSVENPRQRRVNLYKLVRLWRDQPYFLQNKANFKNGQMNIKLNITRDYEKYIAPDIW